VSTIRPGLLKSSLVTSQRSAVVKLAPPLLMR
jgi:hypothetical protein